MSQIQTIFKNMSWLLISQIIGCICAFIWTILMARYLGVTEYGIFGFTTSLTGILIITDDLGINVQIVRHISTDYDSSPKYLGNIMPLKAILAVGTFLITLIILIIMKANELTITITLLFTIEMIFKSYVGLLNGTFQAFEKGKYQGIGNTILNSILLIFILISIYSDLGLYGIAISYILANLFAFIYEFYVLRKHVTQPNYELDINYCKNIIKLSLPFAVGGILYAVYYQIDAVMLTNLVGSYSTGIYNATYKLISVLTLFYSIYTAVIFPVMSKFYKNDASLFFISFEKSVKYLMLIMLPIAIGTMFYSLDIIQLIYGHEYDAASSVLSILIWTVCLLFISGACNTLLLAAYKEVTTLKIYGIAAVVNIVLNFFMIPAFAENGAAITTVLSEFVLLIIFLYVMYKMGHKPNKKLYYDLIKIIVGSIILGIALYLLNLNMWVALPVGILIYFSVMYLIRFFDEDDKYIIKEILGKN